MTDQTTSADIVTFRKRPMTNAERQQAFRDRKRAAKLAEVAAPLRATQKPAGGLPAVRPQGVAAATIVIPVTPVTPSRFELSPWVLRAASIAMAGVGLSMNAVYAHSLGSSDVSGWLFLALGVAADSAALVLPSVAASAWKSNDRLAAVSAWATFAVVFAFAIIGSVGFASTSISDVTTLRSSRVTPAVTAAQGALADAMTARDRECKGGVGKFCREREAAVIGMRQNLELAMHQVEAGSDPQAQALVRLVSFVSQGMVAPTEASIAMIRLALLAFLPQIGGILLMVSRRS